MNRNKNTELLINAVATGDVDEVDQLIYLSPPKIRSYALEMAAAKGQIKCVQLLIPVAAQKDNESYVLQLSTETGYRWRCRLFKSNFQMTQKDGSILPIRLRPFNNVRF